MNGGPEGSVPEGDGAQETRRGTVAVVDMVGYSTVARMLEQNISAASVAELNRQIQGFISVSLQQLPDQAGYRVVTRTGDGIIVLFDEANAAHWFGVGVHRAARKHNERRTESTAQRWFRVGVATGSVSAVATEGLKEEYAGTTIADAVRLESAAEAGEILMDEASFAGLSEALQAEYGPVEVVKGKREERFRARRCRVIAAHAAERVDGGEFLNRPAQQKIRPSPRAGEPAGSHRRRILRGTMLGAVYLGVLVGLWLWERSEHPDEFTPNCEIASDSTHTALYSRPYRWFLARVAGESVTPVSVVAIPANLPEIQGNACVGRMYLADLLRSIAGQHPSVIVVDKSFAPASCSFLPAATAELVQAMQSVDVPVVVGESTDTADAVRGGACLVRRPQLDFATPQVHRAVFRLNPEYETIPLGWNVMSGPADVPPKVERSDSLAWATVKLYEPGFAERASMKQLAGSSRDLFANLNLTIPKHTSTEVLCSVGTPAMRARWSASCVPGAATPTLLGKVVVIGSEDASDRQRMLGTTIFGFELQARYIQALLAGAYLRQTPIWLECLLYLLYLGLIEAVPWLLEMLPPDGNRWRLVMSAVLSWRSVWVIAWAVAFIVLASTVSVGLGYLPPLAVYGAIVLVAMARLLLFPVKTADNA